MTINEIRSSFVYRMRRMILHKWLRLSFFAAILLTSNFLYAASSAEDLVAKGMTFVKAKDFKNALVCFEQAHKASPTDPTRIMFVGNCYNELGEYPKAIDYFQLAMRTGGVSAVLAGNMSDTYQKMGENSKALYWMQVNCALDPAEARNPKNLAIIKKLQDPLSNPTAPPNAPDYLQGLAESHIWQKNLVPIRVYVPKDQKLASIHAEFRKAVKESLDQWCTAIGGAITYKFVDSPTQATLVCAYTDDPRQVRSDHEIGTNGNTEVHIAKDSNAIDRTSTVILIAPVPGGTGFSTNTIAKVCLHELGHAMGLHGHSSNNHDVMFFLADTPSVPLQLSDRDKRTIKKLYANCKQR